METGAGRGLVKHNPQSRHCTTMNQRPTRSRVGSGASTSGDQLSPPHNRHVVSSQSMFESASAKSAEPRGGKIINFVLEERSVRAVRDDSQRAAMRQLQHADLPELSRFARLMMSDVTRRIINGGTNPDAASPWPKTR